MPVEICIMGKWALEISKRRKSRHMMSRKSLWAEYEKIKKKTDVDAENTLVSLLMDLLY